MKTTDASGLSIQLWSRLSREVDAKMSRLFDRVIVTDVLADGRLQVTSTDPSDDGTHTIACLSSVKAAPGDHVLTASLAGRAIALGTLASSSHVEPDYALQDDLVIVRARVPFAWNSATPVTTANTSTPQEFTGFDLALPEGRYGYVMLATGLMARAANSGAMVMRIAIGSDTRDITLSSANLDISVPRPVAVSRGSTGSILIPPGGGTVRAAVLFRGATTAGNTTMQWADLSGQFWRVA